MTLKKLKSGAVVDTEQGNRIVAAEDGPYRITPEKGREMNRIRYAKARQAAATGVLKKAIAINPEISTLEEAWAFLNGRLLEQVLDSDKPRAEAVETLGKNIGAIPRATDLREERNQPAPLPAGVTFSIDALIELASRLDTELRQRTADSLIEAEIAD